MQLAVISAALARRRSEAFDAGPDAAAPSPTRPAGRTRSTAASSPPGRARAGCPPATVDVRALRRYAAGLSERGPAPTTVARKLAALRGLFRVQMELGQRCGEPGRAAELAQARPAPAAGAAKRRGRGAAGPDPGRRRRCELRDRALFELAYASGLRAEELVSLDVESLDFDAETVRVEGKGGKTRLVPVGRARAARRSSATWQRGPPAHCDVRRSRRARCSCRSRAGGSSTSDVRRRLRTWARQARGAARRRSPTRIRTRCATRSRPICWRAAPICARSRNCSAMQPSRRRRSTLG